MSPVPNSGLEGMRPRDIAPGDLPLGTALTHWPATLSPPPEHAVGIVTRGLPFLPMPGQGMHARRCCAVGISPRLGGLPPPPLFLWE